MTPGAQWLTPPPLCLGWPALFMAQPNNCLQLENGQQRASRGGFLQSWFVDYHPCEMMMKIFCAIIPGSFEQWCFLCSRICKENIMKYFIITSDDLCPDPRPIRGQCSCQLTNERPGVLWRDGAIKPSLQAGNLKARASVFPPRHRWRPGPGIVRGYVNYLK